MAVKRETLREGLAKLESQLKSLREKQDIGLESYKRDGDLQAIVERRLQNAIQACIDLGMHIVAEEGPRKPETYGDVFVILSEMGVIGEGLSKKMVEKAGFRNVLAHEYAEIINEEVYAHLQNLKAFEEFAKALNAYVKA